MALNGFTLLASTVNFALARRFFSTTRQEPKEATAKAPRRQEIQELGVLAPWRFP
jgi:hypothetical protein